MAVPLPARLTAPLAALVVAACVSAESWEAVRVLEDVVARSRPSDLKARTPAPSRQAVAYPAGARRVAADVYRPNQPVGGRLVLVPGFTPHGKDDARVVDLATTFARARFTVLVPNLVGSREGRVRLEDADDIADAAAYLAETEPPAATPVGIVAISYAVGLAVQATGRPRARAAAPFLVGIGGYYDVESVIAFITTGKYRLPGEFAWRDGNPNPIAKWVFLESNLDAVENPSDRAALRAIAERRRRAPEALVDDLTGGLGPEGRALFDLLTNTDVRRVAGLLAALPDTVRRHIGRFTLKGRDLGRLAGRLILIHGDADTLIPHSESVALAEAVPGTDLHVIEGFSHIDPRGVGIAAQLQLIDAVQAVLRRRQRAP
jgi:pimeloyl-ACP methyl ester carboxylesterase